MVQLKLSSGFITGALLVGMQIDTATMDNSKEIP